MCNYFRNPKSPKQSCRPLNYLSLSPNSAPKQIFGFKKSTTNCIIYGKLGLIPVSVLIKNRILNYWCKLENSNESRICNIVYRTACSHYSKMTASVLPWLTCVHSILDNLGMSYVWYDQVVEYPSIFKNKIKNCINRLLHLRITHLGVWTIECQYQVRITYVSPM